MGNAEWDTPIHLLEGDVLGCLRSGHSGCRENRLQGTAQPVGAVRQEIHRSVCRLAFNSRLGSFMESYRSRNVDASLLLLPLVGFLPPDDRRIAGTVRLIEKRLMRNGFVMRTEGRNRRKREGAFLPCSFWLADYYELTGRAASAKRLLNRLMKIRNDVGLLSERI